MDYDISQTTHLMGGDLRITITSPHPQKALQAINAAFQEAKRLEGIFSVYDPQSELSRLNKERTLTVSKDLRTVLWRARWHAEISGGLFNPAIGNEIIAAKNYIQNGGTPPHKPIHDGHYRKIKFDGKTVSLGHAPYTIDLGGIAKGYIVDKLVETLKKEGTKQGIVDARGDIRVFGPRPIKIQVEDPQDSKKSKHTFMLKDAAVATSGNYRQHREKTGHIINPFNTPPQILSASVIKETCADADALTKTIFNLPLAKAISAINHGVIIASDGKVHAKGIAAATTEAA
ncbi:ApbE family protein [uncultured archaeon]|nr:ApbE family protein [uncultured archaeon]